MQLIFLAFAINAFEMWELSATATNSDEVQENVHWLSNGKVIPRINVKDPRVFCLLFVMNYLNIIMTFSHPMRHVHRGSHTVSECVCECVRCPFVCFICFVSYVCVPWYGCIHVFKIIAYHGMSHHSGMDDNRTTKKAPLGQKTTHLVFFLLHIGIYLLIHFSLLAYPFYFCKTCASVTY